MTELREHWQAAYSEKAVDQRSWSSDADVSVRLIQQYSPRVDARIVDVGGGASPLAHRLIEVGYLDVSVVDISQQALDEARMSTPSGSRVTWMCADIREWTPAHNYDVWHDRAVLHFLVDEDDRLRYARLVTEALNKTGILIVAAFAEDGPEMCSGLPVRRATQDDLVALFGDGFSVADCFREMHRTPWGSEQPFNWIVLRRH